MTDDRRQRRSSFFPKPVEESKKKPLELFCEANWVEKERENIISRSVLYGEQGKKILHDYTEKLKKKKQEYDQLVYNKKEHEILLKEKLRKNKLNIDWETACEGLTDFEKDFANNRPDDKCLAEKAHSLYLHTALVKQANFELHTVLNTYNKQANEEIHKLKESFIDNIVEDSSGVDTLFDDSSINSSALELSVDTSNGATS